MARFILLKTFNNYIEANIALSMLEEEGINCHVEDQNSAIIMNMASGLRLMVYETQVERATEILKGVESEFLNSIKCTLCHHTGFTIKYVTENHDSDLKKIPFGRLLSFMSKALSKEGTTLEVKHYVCNNCAKEFDELPY